MMARPIVRLHGTSSTVLRCEGFQFERTKVAFTRFNALKIQNGEYIAIYFYGQTCLKIVY